ncbi:MAG: peptidylprolyl isomerase [Planctomycetota bacterium]
MEGIGTEAVPPSTLIDARPAALVEGRVVDWGELRPLLNEAAGADVLADVVLDRMLVAELDDAGILITAQELDAERALFYETLSPDPDTAARLARQLRARQGLGRQRLDRLLRRNAALRALVRDRVEITEEAISRMYEIAHGPKRQARLIVAPTLNDAQAAINRVNAGELFADVAVEVSTDTSAARGGMLEPISRADASYPQALREAVWALEPGELSRPVFLGDRYAVLALLSVFDGDRQPPPARAAGAPEPGADPDGRPGPSTPGRGERHHHRRRNQVELGRTPEPVKSASRAFTFTTRPATQVHPDMGVSYDYSPICARDRVCNSRSAGFETAWRPNGMPRRRCCGGAGRSALKTLHVRKRPPPQRAGRGVVPMQRCTCVTGRRPNGPTRA